MKNLIVNMSRNTITFWLFVAFMGMAAFAFAEATEQEFVGEVIRVEQDTGKIVLKIQSVESVEVEPMTISVVRSTQMNGVMSFKDIKPGDAIVVKAEKSEKTSGWVASHLAYKPTKIRTGMSPTDVGRLHDAEMAFAQGNMGDVEFETRRQVLQK